MRIPYTVLVITMWMGTALAQTRPSVQPDLTGIDKLHQQDKQATLSDRADRLSKLWDKDAVRFSQARRVEIGAAEIYADDQQWEKSSGRERSLCYDYEIQDVQISGDWAFEWGYFSYKIAKGGKESLGYGKGLRVMKRQSDGTWKFARVMSLADPSASSVVLQHPCPEAPARVSVRNVGASVAASDDKHDSAEQDRAGIERLHQQDEEATLSDRADQLAKLWDKDAVRFSVGRPAEISAAVIYADDKQWEKSSGRERSLCYDLEVQDLQIAGDWAFEWGYGSYKVARGDKESILYGKLLRVMKKQSDGSWRFARVMSLAEPTPSTVVLQHPCQ